MLPRKGPPAFLPMSQRKTTNLRSGIRRDCPARHFRAKYPVIHRRFVTCSCFGFCKQRIENSRCWVVALLSISDRLPFSDAHISRNSSASLPYFSRANALNSATVFTFGANGNSVDVWPNNIGTRWHLFSIYKSFVLPTLIFHQRQCPMNDCIPPPYPANTRHQAPGPGPKTTLPETGRIPHLPVLPA